MTAAEYQEALKQNKMYIDTVGFHVISAFNDAVKVMLDIVDSETNLEDCLRNLAKQTSKEDAKEGFVNAYKKSLRNSVIEFCKIKKGVDNETIDQIVFGITGIELKDSGDLYDWIKGRDSGVYQSLRTDFFSKSYESIYDFYDEFLEEKTQYSQRVKEKEPYPGDYLSTKDLNEVLEYVGLKDDKRIRTRAVGVKEMADLIKEFDRCGIIPPKFLAGKRYFIKQST